MNAEKAQRIREAKIRSVNLALSREGISADDYDLLREAAKWGSCPQCGDTFNRVNGFDGPASDAGSRYCSPLCITNYEQAQAVLIKPSANDSSRINGWDV